MAQLNADDAIAELQGEVARLRVKLRAARAHKAMLLEALAPFAAAWPLRSATFMATEAGSIARQRREGRALAGFYTANTRGTGGEVSITLTGEHLREAYEAVMAAGGTIPKGDNGHA